MQANALIENLHVYHDQNENGEFDPSDPLVTSVTILDLGSTGVQSVALPAADPRVVIDASATKTYFVAAELTPRAGAQLFNQFRITHVTEASSTARNRQHRQRRRSRIRTKQQFVGHYRAR